MKESKEIKIGKFTIIQLSDNVLKIIALGDNNDKLVIEPISSNNVKVIAVDNNLLKK